MPGTARQGGGAETFRHFGGVRLRVNGSGNLDMALYSLDDVESDDVPLVAMQLSTGVEPFRLSNLVTQRASLRVGTNEINEYFKINRILLFNKVLWSELPEDVE